VEMHQIQYFLAVAKCLNFTRAAEELRIAQPSLTRAIHKLEAELGGPLVRRERMKTHLTELGRMVLPDLEAASAAADAAKTQAHRVRTGDVGSLALGVSVGLDTNRVISNVLDVAQTLRGLQVAVEVADPDAVRRKLIKGDFDAAVLSVQHEAVERLDLLQIDMGVPVVAFAASHKFNTSKNIELRELAAESLAVCSQDWTDAALVAALAADGLSRRVSYRSNDARWIAELVRRELGVAVMSAAMASSFKLCHRPFAGVSFQPRSVLATVAGRRHSRAVAMLIRRFRNSGPPSIPARSEICEAS
jgi:DNA-binding transcriptional LysR family regulator